MRLVYINPGFADYMPPLYGELNTLCGGKLTVVYSVKRTAPRVHKNMRKLLGVNALALDGERILARKNWDSGSKWGQLGYNIP